MKLKLVDNFEEIKKLLVFGTNIYYFLQIIKRKKDPGNEKMKSSEQQKWSKFIVSENDLDNLKEDIVGMCKLFNARAYIELNPRCLERFSIISVKKLIDRIYLKDFNRIGSYRNKIALDECTIKTKGIISGRRWVVDVDNPSEYLKVKSWIEKNNIEIHGTIETPGGKHIIIKSFNYKSLGIKLEKEFIIEDGITITIKPFANTILYYEP